ncbi:MULTISPECIES: late competence development ComFB family protein [Corallincola]|uniref:Competence protein ComFB n=3 Tax=Corallincola TaxID=1775176 RepID=A0A368NGZ9_9GAMM|nr:MULTISPECIES: late competence development ComFB family protein [Corallincola]RCU49400.1 competence protein ComFB [Corallincola holothuriorum]TAA47688.1 competence protein ComFB [Corallincola spongiicola]TCI01557.1 competence protein ComFB [Corallincola luteus]
MKLDLDIRNYFEQLVAERIAKLNIDESDDVEFQSDLMCLALNQLPPRYIRHEVDMAFYLPANERLQMEMQANEAVEKSLHFLRERASEA